MVLMAGVIFTEPEVSVDVDADADAELMLSWEVRLLCGLLKKINDHDDKLQTSEVGAISAAVDVEADADAELRGY